MKCFQIVGNNVIPGLPIVYKKKPFVRIGRGSGTGTGFLDILSGGCVPVYLSESLLANPGDSIRDGRLLDAELKRNADGTYTLDRSTSQSPNKALVQVGFDGTNVRYNWRFRFDAPDRAQATHYMVLAARHACLLGLFILVEMHVADEIQVYGTYSETIPGTPWYLSLFRHRQVENTRATIRFDGELPQVSYAC